MADHRPTGEDAPERGPRETAPGESVGPARPIERDAAAGRPLDEGALGDEAPPEEAPPAEGTGQPIPAVEAAQAPTTVQPPATDPMRRTDPPPSRPGRRQRTRGGLSAVDKVRRTSFPVVMRGYDRAAVDDYVAEVAQLVAELEATQLPETVVQRALDQVGEETSTILKHAHETAEEITARARSQADGRVQEAHREAERAHREAETHARRLEEDTHEVWDERRRLIEDIRHLADDVLALADDALERIPPPAGVDEATTVSVEETVDEEPDPALPAADTAPEDEDTAERGPAAGGFHPS